MLSLSEQGIASRAGLSCQLAGSLPARLSEPVPCIQSLLCLLLLCHSVLPFSFGLPIPLPSVTGLQTSVLLLACPCLSFLPDFFSLLTSSFCSGKSDECLPCCPCVVAWHEGFSLSFSLWDSQPTFSRNSLKSLGTVRCVRKTGEHLGLLVKVRNASLKSDQKF